MRNTIVITLISLGAGIMCLSAWRTRGILNLLKDSELTRYWQFLLWLMAFFLGGYLVTIGLVLAGLTEILLLLIGVVFFGGAVFVYMVVQLGYSTIESILRKTMALEKTEADLREHRAQLEEMVAERTTALVETNKQLQQEVEEHKRTEVALNQAKKAAEAANRAKSLFLANMSHELRTPLHAILGFAQVMRESDALSMEHQQNLAAIVRNGENLLVLINKVLDLSSVDLEDISIVEDDSVLYREPNGQEMGRAHFSAADLAVLPADLLRALEEATVRSNIGQIFTVIEQIRDHDAAAADALARLANEFEYGKILALIQQTITGRNRLVPK